MDLSDVTRVRPDPNAAAHGGTAVPPTSPPADPDATRVLADAAPTPPVRPRLPVTMPPGTQLHEYRVARVLGQGGFGITYLATDVHLNAQVAIKEYLPEEIAFRAADGQVKPNASGHAERYRLGLESFLNEARTLAALRHPAIVRVARFFEANGTAYMVLEYEQGQPLKAWWPQHRRVGEAGLVELLLPLLDGLAAVHAAGFLHRDIKPENIQVRDSDGSLVLLDFGSAGQVVALGEQGAVVVTPGYAPIEQYGLGDQGPWTDVYALAATLYWAATGQRPPDAESRAAHPALYVPAARLHAAGARSPAANGFGHAFLKAIDWALAPEAHARPRDIAQFRRALCADHVNSLNLQEALQAGEGDAAAQRPRTRRFAWLARLAPSVGAPRDWPLTVKLALLLVFTALLPMLMAGAWNLRGGSDALARAELGNVEQVARSAAGRVGQFIQDARQVARGLADDDAFARFLASPDPALAPALQGRLARVVRADPDVQLIILMDTQGKAVISNDPEVTGKSFAFRRYFREASAGRAYTSGIVVGAVAGATGFFVSEPVAGPSGEQVGVLVLRVLGSSVARIIDEIKQDATLTPFLVDGDGVVLHHPDRERVFKSLAPLSAQQQAEIKADQRFRLERVESLGEVELAGLLRAAQGSGYAGHASYRSVADRRDEITGFAPVPGHDWMVAVSESRHAFEAPMRDLYQQLLLSSLLVGALFTGLALRFARGIVQPIRRLTESANALKAGNFDNARVTVTSSDEVGQLGRTFNVMIDVLRQRERERRIDR